MLGDRQMEQLHQDRLMEDHLWVLPRRRLGERLTGIQLGQQLLLFHPFVYGQCSPEPKDPRDLLAVRCQNRDRRLGHLLGGKCWEGQSRSLQILLMGE